MAFKAIIDKLEDVEESVRQFYVQKDDGKFHLEIEGLEDNSSALKAAQTALKRANDDAAKRRKQLEDWQAIGKTPEEILTLINKQAEDQRRREEEDAANKGQWEQLRVQMNEKHAGEIKKLQDQIAGKDRDIAALRSRLESHVVQSAAVAAIAGEKGIPELLLPAVRNSIKLVENNTTGQFDIQVVDTKGEPRVNGKGEPLTLAELVGEMRNSEVYGRAFEGTGATGSGAQPPRGGPPGNIARRADLKTEKERAAFIDKHGLPAYQALPM